MAKRKPGSKVLQTSLSSFSLYPHTRDRLRLLSLVMGMSMVRLAGQIIENGLLAEKKQRRTIQPQALNDALEAARGTRTHIKIDRALQTRFRAYSLARTVPMMQLFDELLEGEITAWERATKVPLAQDRDVVKPLLK